MYLHGLSVSPSHSLTRALQGHRQAATHLLVRTRSLAWMRSGPIWPFFALFLMSATSFFSWFSSLTRSRSNSRCVFSRARWCLRRRSAGVMRLPNAHSTSLGRVSGRVRAGKVGQGDGHSWWQHRRVAVVTVVVVGKSSRVEAGGRMGRLQWGAHGSRCMMSLSALGPAST
jgi:hypothetical protein